MMRSISDSPFSLGVLSVVLSALPAAARTASSWPQWRGPGRENRGADVGLLDRWPSAGPGLLWTNTTLAFGYSTVSIARGVIYTTGNDGGTGMLYALELDGRLRWKKVYGPEWTENYAGSRTTPTIDEGHVYVFSGRGRLVCLDADSGEKRWAVDTLKRFSGRTLQWGLAESILIVGNLAICAPGGPNASVVALDKRTGRTVWTTRELSERSAFCSPTVVERGGRRIIATMLEDSLVGIDAADGRRLWRHPYRNRWAAHPNTPVYADGMLYCSAGYGSGGFMLRLSPEGDSASLGWVDKALDCHHHGLVLHQGHIYGCNHRGTWVCLDLATGSVAHTAEGVGKGMITYADGMLYCYGVNGTAGLVKATPRGHEVVSSFRVPHRTRERWSHPVVCGGRLYIRSGTVLAAYDVRAK